MSVTEVKLCLIGDSGVGKSSLVQRFVHDTFNPNLESTIGASFMTKTLIHDSRTFKFQIWDTAGQERYRALAPMYYRGAGAAIIVYDVTQEQSFQSVKSWVRELNNHGSQNIILAIAGNKCDLEERREVSLRDAQSYADSMNAIFMETSAKTAHNIINLFREICYRLDAKKSGESSEKAVRLGVSPEQGTRSGKCCGGSNLTRSNSSSTREAS